MTHLRDKRGTGGRRFSQIPFRISFCILIMLVPALAMPVSANLITIHTLNPGDSIQQNITSALDGDTIILNPGTYNEHNIIIDQNVKIRANTTSGGTAANTVIDAQNLGRIFNVTSGVTVTFDNLTLLNGAADNGGAIYVSGSSPTTIFFNSSVIHACAASMNGGEIPDICGEVNMGETLRPVQGFMDQGHGSNAVLAFLEPSPGLFILDQGLHCQRRIEWRRGDLCRTGDAHYYELHILGLHRIHGRRDA